MSIKLKNTNAYMKSYSEKLIELLRKEMATPQIGREAYDNPSIDATGEGSRSLRVVDYRNGIFEVVGNDYLLKVDKGNNKRVEVQDIAEWIVAKPVNYESTRKVINLQGANPNEGIVQALAKRITNKIRQNGTTPTNFIKRTVESHLKNLKVVAPVVEDVRESVVDILKAAGFDLEGKTVKFN